MAPPREGHVRATLAGRGTARACPESRLLWSDRGALEASPSRGTPVSGRYFTGKRNTPCRSRLDPVPIDARHVPLPLSSHLTADAQLSERDALLRGAFDDAPIGMALISLDGRWVRVNQALREIVGYSEPELLALTSQAITHPDDLARGVELHRQLLAGERTRYQYESGTCIGSGTACGYR